MNMEWDCPYHPYLICQLRLSERGDRLIEKKYCIFFLSHSYPKNLVQLTIKPLSTQKLQAILQFFKVLFWVHA